MSDTEDQAYASALGALQFFSLEQPQQLESLAKAPTEQPRFFLEQLDVDRGCDYFIGVACVFKTYKGLFTTSSRPPTKQSALEISIIDWMCSCRMERRLNGL